MVDVQAAIALTKGPARSANRLCFLLEEDFAFRQELARELRRNGIDVVEFSNSSRLSDMVDEQNPDIVFIKLNNTAPQQCIRALLALKDCRYSGAVQLFGHCEQKILEGFNAVGADCSLAMLAPLQKPITFAKVLRIILDRKTGAAATPSRAVSLDDALAKNWVKFHYQPKFNLKTKVIVGAEAVVRVAHPELGWLTPDHFLKGADEDALLKLSRLALVDALKASAHFHEQGIVLQLAINIGADSLLNLPVADLALIHRPERGEWPGILLEVPARQVVNKIESLKARSPSLLKSGVSIAIDNFGCGSISLDILGKMPFSEIKIDRSLVQDCATNKDNARICKTVIQMAHNFGSRAAAVGISTEADLRTLLEFDCDVGQGFLFGKPMTTQQIDALIASFSSEAS
jgi:EAL domain-containing protein (putative c-di-GMP-specific phosphodiesterase class I)